MADKPGRSWIKWSIIVLAVVTVVLAGVWYFGGDRSGVPQYQTVLVARGDLVQIVTATGTLNPVTNVTVGSQISGIIQSLYADWN